MESPTPPDASRPLAGVRVLVVEDDTFILMGLEAVVIDAGGEPAGLCRSVDEALPLLDAREIDVAILDFGMGKGTVAPLADRLDRDGTPFCFYTGQVATDPQLAAWRGHTIIQKPAQPRMIVDTLARLAARGATSTAPIRG